MSNGYNSAECELMARALHQALERLALQRLVNGDADKVSAILTQSILEAAARGERDEEALVLSAIAAFRETEQRPQ